MRDIININPLNVSDMELFNPLSAKRLKKKL